MSGFGELLYFVCVCVCGLVIIMLYGVFLSGSTSLVQTALFCSTYLCHQIDWFIGRKEMFYLTTHSTHFIYGYMASDYGKGPLK